MWVGASRNKTWNGLGFLFCCPNQTRGQKGFYVVSQWLLLKKRAIPWIVKGVIILYFPCVIYHLHTSVDKLCRTLIAVPHSTSNIHSCHLKCVSFPLKKLGALLNIFYESEHFPTSHYKPSLPTDKKTRGHFLSHLPSCKGRKFAQSWPLNQSPAEAPESDDSVSAVDAFTPNSGHTNVFSAGCFSAHPIHKCHSAGDKKDDNSFYTYW